MQYHQPVLLEEAIAGLNLSNNGIFIDATFGGGGHARRILQNLGPKGRLFAFDQDMDAHENAIEDKRLTLVHGNFEHIKRFLLFFGINQVDGILADLGVSSWQFDVPERGFSYRFDAALDMRMNVESKTTASIVLNEYTEAELLSIFSELGQVRNSKTLAKAVVSTRIQQPFLKIEDLNDLLDKYYMGHKPRYFAQVYQALRIEVNDELGVLKKFLKASMDLLKPDGRLVVISYHSLEDKLVKTFMKTGNFSGDFVKDDFGKINRPFKLISKKAVIPSQSEIDENVRARSAKMRIAEKVEIQES